MEQLSKDLSRSLADYESFLPFIKAYAVWSRTNTDIPKNYKCFLAKSVLEESEREYRHSLPILSENDAKMIDYAAAQVTHSSYYKHKLFEILVLSGWNCIDAYFSIKLIKKLLRQNHEKFSIILLEQKRRDLIEMVRYKLIEIEDNDYQREIK